MVSSIHPLGQDLKTAKKRLKQRSPITTTLSLKFSHPAFLMWAKKCAILMLRADHWPRRSLPALSLATWKNPPTSLQKRKCESQESLLPRIHHLRCFNCQLFPSFRLRVLRPPIVIPKHLKSFQSLPKVPLIVRYLGKLCLSMAPAIVATAAASLMWRRGPEKSGF